jgi:hypothetical protein
MHGFPCFEWLTVRMWIFWRNSIKRTKSNSYIKHFYNCAKMVHVGLHSVVTYHKKFGLEKNILPSVQEWHSAKPALPSIRRKTLGTEASLPSVRARHLAKITTIRYRRLTALCREPGFAECLALGKVCRVSFFAESPTLDKRGHYRVLEFVECGTR